MSADDFKAKGNAALQAKNFDEAIAMYTKAIELNGTNHVFFSNRSAAYLSKGDAGGALADADRCIELNPSWPKGYSRKGAALHSLKRYNDAIAAFEEGIKLAPGDAGLLEGLEQVEKAQASAVLGAAGGGGGRGGNLFGLTEGEVITKLIGHPKYGPYVGDTVFMGRLKMLLNDPSALSQVQSDPRILEVFGYLLGIDMTSTGARGDPAGDATAMEEDDEWEDVGAGAAGGSDAAAAAAAAGGSPPRPPPAAATSPPKPPAEEETGPEAKADRELERRKKESLVVKKRGNDAYTKKEFEEALRCYDEAAALDPTNMTFLTNKAAVYFELKDYDKCVELCREAVEVGRSNRANYEDIAKAYVRAGRAMAKKGDLQAAVEQYGKAQMESYTKETERLIKSTELELRKQQAAAYIDPAKGLEAKESGNEHFRAGNWPAAIADYEDAVKRDPTNPAYRNNLAAAFSKVLDFNAAKAACEKALELDPKYVKAWAKKGDIELLMKEYHKALDSYKKGLEIDPDNATCKQGFIKTQLKIQDSMGGEVDRERAAHAMADPDIQNILADPIVQTVLRDLGENPAAGQKALQDPSMRAKIEKLIAAGVLQTR